MDDGCDRVDLGVICEDLEGMGDNRRPGNGHRVPRPAATISAIVVTLTALSEEPWGSPVA
jgi:hypothetical protein